MVLTRRMLSLTRPAAPSASFSRTKVVTARIRLHARTTAAEELAPEAECAQDTTNDYEDLSEQEEAVAALTPKDSLIEYKCRAKFFHDVLRVVEKLEKRQ